MFKIKQSTNSTLSSLPANIKISPYKLSPCFSAYFKHIPKKVHQKPVLPQIYQSFLFSHLLKEFKNIGCKHIYLKFALLMIITARYSYLTKPA